MKTSKAGLKKKQKGPENAKRKSRAVESAVKNKKASPSNNITAGALPWKYFCGGCT
jgi:hypothetical protein